MLTYFGLIVTQEARFTKGSFVRSPVPMSRVARITEARFCARAEHIGTWPVTQNP
jgi:hypothetical protein